MSAVLAYTNVLQPEAGRESKVGIDIDIAAEVEVRTEVDVVVPEGSQAESGTYAFVSLSAAEADARLAALANPTRTTFDAATARSADVVSFQPCQSYSSQDRHVVKELDIRGQKWTFTGVFDGHLGDATVQHTAHHLPIIVSEFLHKVVTGPSAPPPAPAIVSDILARAITSFDDAIAGDVLALFPGGLAALPARSSADIRAVLNDYCDGGENYHKARLCMYGTTALVALVDPAHEHLWVANLGDSDAVLVSQSAAGAWECELLNNIHNGDSDAEVERVQREHPGEAECVLDGRVLGAIAPFRCIGDAPFKQPALFTRRILYNLYPGIPDSSPWDAFLDRNLTPPYISARPEITHRSLRAYAPPCGLAGAGGARAGAGEGAGKGRDRGRPYLVLATDGLAELYDGFAREEMAQDWARVVGAAVAAARPPPHFRSRAHAHAAPEENAALALLRHALGDDLVTVSQLLTLDMDRPWMDDTTIVVQAL